MAGGGVHGSHIHGTTDEPGRGITRDPVHINDFHATLLHPFGLDRRRLRISGEPYEVGGLFE